MKRRTFVQHSIAAGAATVGGALVGSRELDATPHRQGSTFTMNFAPHFGMFKEHAGSDPIGQLQLMADEGFRALEDNDMKQRPVELQERIAREMTRLSMRMGVFVAHTISWREPNLTTDRDEDRDQFLREIRDSVEVAQRVNAKWMTVVPGHLDLRVDMGYQTANVVDKLRRASEILEPHGLVIVLEPLNFRNHPGLFLTKMAQAFEICRAVNSPSCKILDDLYHQQVQEGNLIPNIDRAWDEIAYFQIGDNPGRKEPTTGEINYKNVFQHIHDKGFRGVMGMEHGNSKPGRAGERAVIDAYRSVDPR
jgi:hydroxypyruvate isomerase